MNLILKYKFAIIFIIVLIAAFVGYKYFLTDDSGGLLLLGGGDESIVDGDVIGRQIVNQLDELERLDLNKDIFDRPSFQSLIDYRQLVQKEPVGRNNPFSKVGTDGSYLGTPFDISFIDDLNSGQPVR
jgi:hypothetical protein